MSTNYIEPLFFTSDPPDDEIKKQKKAYKVYPRLPEMNLKDYWLSDKETFRTFTEKFQESCKSLSVLAMKYTQIDRPTLFDSEESHKENIQMFLSKQLKAMCFFLTTDGDLYATNSVLTSRKNDFINDETFRIYQFYTQGKKCFISWKRNPNSRDPKKSIELFDMCCVGNIEIFCVYSAFTIDKHSKMEWYEEFGNDYLVEEYSSNEDLKATKYPKNSKIKHYLVIAFDL
ncbi:hypothetical protein EIN_135060 [Entamoeba invadens IP1]|uniref:Uncharacterized protein n=1 Tax=Entamoeba invadens IP1 TaxID=370355 RepID=A0A0A1TXB7_ENTIV|nr:hypothetical protein EIN_135060 [Entamoeba invadens IP1]ELP85922.1 hypothetical protein EIN_135060 [Entamoeba invadens IP1]|eukprot:XP_004185268.1 hypothetical protein EIN_135060 [Entamoeba invadens IP1]